MQEPLKRGDLAVILRGRTGETSPNVGKIVTVGPNAGESKTLGRLVWIHGESLVLVDNLCGTESKAPTAWLKRVDPPLSPAPKSSVSRPVAA